MTVLADRPDLFARLITDTWTMPQAAAELPLLGRAGRRGSGQRECVKIVIELDRETEGGRAA